MAAEEVWLHRGLAVQRARLRVDGGGARPLRVEKGLVGVAHDQRVDTGQRGQRQGGVLPQRAAILPADAGVAQYQDKVGAGRADAGNSLVRGLKDAAGAQRVAQGPLAYGGDLWRPHAREAHADPGACAVRAP
jgi:hypothetical protein